MRIWLMKITIVFEREIDAVSLRSAWLIKRAWRPGCTSPISPSISARGVSAATESMTRTSTAPERTSVSVISSACSPSLTSAAASASGRTPAPPRTSMESFAYILILALAISTLFFAIAFRDPPKIGK